MLIDGSVNSSEDQSMTSKDTSVVIHPPAKTPIKPQTQDADESDMPIIDMNYFKMVGENDKLDLLMAAINKINTTFHYKFEDLRVKLLDSDQGILPRVHDVEKKCNEIEASVEVLDARLEGVEGKIPDFVDMQKKMDYLEKQQHVLMDQVATLRGLIQVQDKAITSQGSKIIDLTARSMANNIIIQGLTKDSKEENCKAKVLSFLQDTMLMTDICEKDVLTAHRLGKKSGPKDRSMIIRRSQHLRDTIFAFTPNLKNKQNENKEYYYVRTQQPDPFYTEKMEREKRMKQIKKTNSDLTNDQDKKKVSIKGNTLYIDDVPQKKHVFPPSVKDLMNMSKAETLKASKFNIAHSDPVEDKGNIFRAHAVRVTNNADIKLMYNQIRLLFPESDNIPMAYTTKFEGYHDDREYGAGLRLQTLLKEQGMKNTVLFVTRDLGIHLGPRRFLHMEKVAKHALSELQAQL